MACTIRQMCDFAGWPVLGWLSPGGIPCLGSVFPLRYRVRAKSSSFPTPAVIDVHITPDVGAISSAPRAPVANRAHRRNNLSRSATGRSRGAITRLDVGMGYSGSMPDPFLSFFGLTGGECGEGRATVSLGRAPTARRVLRCCSGAAADALAQPRKRSVPFPSVARRSEFLIRLPALNLVCLA
jgi:hypothetical protein